MPFPSWTLRQPSPARRPATARRCRYKSDVWALGCILYELLALRHAFDGRDMDQLVQRILKGAYAPLPEARLCSPHRRPTDALSFAIAHACASIHPLHRARRAPVALEGFRLRVRSARWWAAGMADRAAGGTMRTSGTAAREMTALRRCIAWRCGSS